MKLPAEKVHLLFVIASMLVLAGCAANMNGLEIQTSKAGLGQTSLVYNELMALPEPKEPIVVAVYKFRDQTGQYQSSSAGMTWSTAVTQGATSMLLKVLEDSRWFVPLEREGLSNLLNERRIIRQTRQQYVGNDGANLPALPPLMYAGITLEGGIISYETNVVTGGFGAKYLGMGGSVQMRKDEVTIYLRAVSTKNGRILKTVQTSKSILSKMVDVGVYRYVKTNRLLEVETGYSRNEPVNLCVQEAIEKAVFCLIIEGMLDNLWELKNAEDMKSPLVRSYLKDRESQRRELQFDTHGSIVNDIHLGTPVLTARKSLSVGTGGSLYYYQGDYAKSRLRGGGELSLKYGLSSWAALQVDGSVGQLAASKGFRTKLSQVLLNVQVSLFPNRCFTPYLVLGGGGINYWIKDSDGDTVVRNRDDYWGWEPVFKVGAGFEWYFDRHLSLQWEVSHHMLISDEVDGVTAGSRDDVYWKMRTGIQYYFK